MDQGAPAASLLEPIEFEALPGWAEHDHQGALDAFRLSCREILDEGTGFTRPVRLGGRRRSWTELCRVALEATDGRMLFESRFRPYRVRDAARPEGLFTGYFEPEVAGSRQETPEFHVPIYRRPPDLAARPYFTRREIEEGALAGRGLELVYLADWADAYFIHVQGSGRVRLTDGSTMRLSFEAKSGLPYTGIGGLLVERGVLSPEAMSMQAIRAWMAGNPEEARALMWENQSFIFFREAVLARPELGALGAQHVQLTPRRSLAVDRSWWMFGTPVWLDAEVPSGDEGGMRSFRQLLIAQDTGSAIRGLARGDVYWGFGEEAARIAGPMKSPGQMTVLLPIEVADELGLPR